MSWSALRQRIRLLESILETDPDNIGVRQELLRHQADYLRQAGGDQRVAQALSDNLEVLWALHPRDLLAAELLAPQADPDHEPGPPRDPEAAGWFTAGIEALGEGRAEQAEQDLTAALLADPTSPAVHLALGRARLARGEAEAAEAHLEFAERAAPGSAAAAAARGDGLAALGRPREALDHWLAALARNPLCARAEQRAIELGFASGYRWVKVPLQPVVWPLIEADGRHWIVENRTATTGPRRAWRTWANAVVAECRGLAPENLPLAGLPRRIELLRDIHEVLLGAWRRWRWLRYARWRNAATAAELCLDWLAAVRRDGLLDAYLYYGYLHPDLGADYRAWRDRHPGEMERFLRRHVMHPDPLEERS